jgi:hypothetical protein
MPPNLHIPHLHVTLRGIRPEVAQAALNEFPEALKAAMQGAQPAMNTRQVTHETSASQIARQLAAQVVQNGQLQRF